MESCIIMPLKKEFNKIISLVRKQKPVRSASDTDKTWGKKQENS